MGRLNNHAIDNGDIEAHYSDYPVESNSESISYPDINMIKPIDYYEMNHILEFFHSEHDDELLDFVLQMLPS